MIIIFQVTINQTPDCRVTQGQVTAGPNQVITLERQQEASLHNQGTWTPQQFTPRLDQRNFLIRIMTQAV